MSLLWDKVSVGGMNSMALWGFDVDSVVGDLSAVLERVAWEEFGVRVSRDQFTEFHLEKCLPLGRDFIVRWIARALEPEWTLEMKPYPKAVEVLRDLAMSQPLYFVTARPEPHTVRRWLLHNLHGIEAEVIIVRAVGEFQGKVPVLKEWGVTHFVEDRLETCEILAADGIEPIVFEQPWNSGRHKFRKVKSWDELKEVIEETKTGRRRWPR